MESNKVETNKNGASYYIRITGVLLVITMSVALLLAFVNAVTKDVIIANEQKKTDEAISVLFPEAQSPKAERKANFDTEIKYLESYYEVKDGDKTVGYYANVKPMGFKGEVNMLVGLTPDGKISGIQILSHGETIGIGDKAMNSSYLDKYKGSGSENCDSVDTISGATYSSKAVKNGAKIALEAFKAAKFAD